MDLDQGEMTWGDLLQEIKEAGFAEDGYFEYGGITNAENDTIEESIIWDEGVTGVAAYCMGGANNEWYVRVDPTYAVGMNIYGKLGRGLIGKFRDLEKAMTAVKFITAKAYGVEVEIEKEAVEHSLEE
jgi:hypothetical protein